MNRIVKVSLCLVLSLGMLGFTGCGYEEENYSRTPADGHLHSYIHKLKDDTYICSLCGYEYPGDPDDLVEK